MGEEEFVTWLIRPTWWAAVGLLSFVSAFVCLDHAKRVGDGRGKDAMWLAGGALALGTGVWSGHFVGLADVSLPFGVGYGGALAFGGWLLAAACCGLSLKLGVSPSAGWLRLGAAGLALGAAVVATEALCFLDMHMAPALSVSAVWTSATVAITAVAGALAYWLFRPARGVRRAAWRHATAAGVIGGSLGAAHCTSMLAARVPIDAVSLSYMVSVSSGMLAVLASLGTGSVLALLMALSVIEAQMHRQLSRAIGRIEEATRTDALTALPNRATFDQQLDAAARLAAQDSRSVTLLFISLDGFKTVNDSFGRDAGDALLQQIATRLKAAARPGDTIARVGGDEFVLLMASRNDDRSAARLAERLVTELAEPCDLGGRLASVACSIGLAVSSKRGDHTSAMLHAEAAARTVKRNGGSAHAFFESHMIDGVGEQLELLRDLRSALSKKQLELYYQPKIHAPSGEITGAEALMRWHHPVRGMVSPAVFIPLAERYGLIAALGDWVIDESCRQVRAWRDQGLRMRVAINLSVHQLRHPDLPERIAGALERHQVNPTQLTCEITESIAMEDPLATMKIFEKLAAVGVHISIDDFGTGYSSLSYLRRLPAKELKIDRSFVLDLEASSDARAVVDAVVKLAQALGLKVVAEGVETEAQNQILRALGCDELQGFLFAKPMPAKALALWAMDDVGPREIDFRDSLFKDTMPAMH